MRVKITRQRLAEAGAFAAGATAGLLTIRRWPAIAIGTGSTWLARKVFKTSNPYLNVLFGFAVSTILSMIVGLSAELVVILAAAAAVDALRMWQEKYEARLTQTA